MTAFDPEAHLTLDTPEGERRLDRTNSALFTHIGELSMYDHVFVQTRKEADAEVGAYIFQHNQAYQQIIQYMASHRFPMHLNASQVADCDKEAFELTLDREAMEDGDFVPQEWLADE